jgi:hypothetical protein
MKAWGVSYGVAGVITRGREGPAPPFVVRCAPCGREEAFPFGEGLTPAMRSYEAGWRIFGDRGAICGQCREEGKAGKPGQLP